MEKNKELSKDIKNKIVDLQKPRMSYTQIHEIHFNCNIQKLALQFLFPCTIVTKKKNIINNYKFVTKLKFFIYFLHRKIELPLFPSSLLFKLHNPGNSRDGY